MVPTSHEWCQPLAVIITALDLLLVIDRYRATSGTVTDSVGTQLGIVPLAFMPTCRVGPRVRDRQAVPVAEPQQWNGTGKSLNSSTWCSGESAGVGGGRREFEPR
jgi:hypothetical protein